MFFKNRDKVVPPGGCAVCGGDIDIMSVPAPPARLRRAILEEAVRIDRHDVLLTPTPNGLSFYYRASGGASPWMEQGCIPNAEQEGVVQAFREGAGLDPAGGRGLEVGLILFEFQGADYDAYAAFLPTRFGTRIAVRIATASDGPSEIDIAGLLQMFA